MTAATQSPAIDLAAFSKSMDTMGRSAAAQIVRAKRINALNITANPADASSLKAALPLVLEMAVITNASARSAIIGLKRLSAIAGHALEAAKAEPGHAETAAVVESLELIIELAARFSEDFHAAHTADAKAVLEMLEVVGTTPGELFSFAGEREEVAA
ncbi:hypothetical protein [Chromobacterium sphagni]|uniref:Uncharacterized protein n=1 Tax=Chromobacterium sphagni TaxID=1903179 RepID=A0ABX3CBA3_9NEIS|nr:hypothetical protein [Chromobacterium sphagni]OHX19565.1 hypothetical protein BI344_17830 [Chromobacterium sphagni]